jgi:hypothetical protein
MIGRIYDVQRGDGLRSHDIYANFHQDWFRHLKVDGSDRIHRDSNINTDTQIKLQDIK